MGGLNSSNFKTASIVDQKGQFPALVLRSLIKRVPWGNAPRDFEIAEARSQLQDLIQMSLGPSTT